MGGRRRRQGCELKENEYRAHARWKKRETGTTTNLVERVEAAEAETGGRKIRTGSDRAQEKGLTRRIQDSGGPADGVRSR